MVCHLFFAHELDWCRMWAKWGIANKGLVRSFISAAPWVLVIHNHGYL